LFDSWRPETLCKSSREVDGIRTRVIPTVFGIGSDKRRGQWEAVVRIMKAVKRERMYKVIGCRWIGAKTIHLKVYSFF
jgi:hypothetical protein